MMAETFHPQQPVASAPASVPAVQVRLAAAQAINHAELKRRESGRESKDGKYTAPAHNTQWHLDDPLSEDSNVPASDPKVRETVLFASLLTSPFWWKELLDSGTDLAGMPPGITRLADGEDLYETLHRLNLLYSNEPGTSCCGAVIDQDHIGVVECQGQIKFTRPGHWKQWSRPASHLVAQSVIETKGVTIVSLNQREVSFEVAVVKDKDGKSTLLKQGRYILQAPAVLLGNGNARGQQLVISLVNLPKQLQVDRYAFFNVPQGEVAGTTCPNGQIRILLPGVHIEQNAKFERFLPTVPIQSKLKKDVITSDLVTVSLEVDITTQLVDCARFLKMSVGHGEGILNLYDALEEPAISIFIDMFSKYKYYEGRTRQGEEESRFEETALNLLDREANKYGGRVLKVNILKYRADLVEASYAAHNEQQIKLEHQKQSQSRQYEIEDNNQKHKQQMAERDEKARTQQQALQHEREIAGKDHYLHLQLKETEAAQRKLDMEAKALSERQKMQATAEAEAAKVRATGEAEAQAVKIRSVAEAEARADEVKGEARVKAVEAMARAIGSNKELLELERQKLAGEVAIRRLQAAVDGGARVVPVELLRVYDLADERMLRRLENSVTLQGMGTRSASEAGSGAGAQAAHAGTAEERKHHS